MNWIFSLFIIVSSQSAFGLANTDQFNIEGKLVFENINDECSIVFQKDRLEGGLRVTSISHPDLGAQEAQQLTDAVLDYGDQLGAGGRKLQGTYTFYPLNLLWVDKIFVTTEINPEAGNYETVSASFSFIKMEKEWFFWSKETEVLTCNDAKLL